MKTYPLLLSPVYTDYIWGGTRLAEVYGRKQTPTPCAESWEVSCHPDGTTLVENGPRAGTPLSVLWDEWGEAFAGSDFVGHPFPLLIKLIDAKQDLSVQVHPNTTNAHLFGGEPKTEMWYVLAATPGATIYAGLKPGTTREPFVEAVEQTRLEEVLDAVEAKPGMSIFVPGGRVHAIGGGCLILEVQQSSNTTYRVYDWGRVDARGVPRELHTEKALGVIDWENSGSDVHMHATSTAGSQDIEELVTCDFFRTHVISLRTATERSGDGHCFRAFFAAHEDVRLRTDAGELLLPEGRTAVVPAVLRNLTLVPERGTATVVEISP